MARDQQRDGPYRQRRSQIYRLSALTLAIAASAPSYAAFNVVQTYAQGGAKQGGAAWADFDRNGCPDAAMGSSGELVLLSSPRQADGGCGMPVRVRSFSDGLDRSVVWGDFDNDGLVDLAANSENELVIFRIPMAKLLASWNIVG